MPHEGLAPRHFGLKGMAERAQLVGGRLDIESTPGTGTTLYIHIPLPTEQHDESGTTDTNPAHFAGG